MKCAILTCTEEKNGNYPTCSSLHGMMFNTARDVVRMLKTDPNDSYALTLWRNQFDSRRPTEEEIKHYE